MLGFVPEPTQHWTVAVSPAERWELFQLMYGKRQDGKPNVTIKSKDEGKRFRRAAAAFGIGPIREAADRSIRRMQARGGLNVLVSPAAKLGPARLHDLIVENIEYVMGLPMLSAEGEGWDASLETALGPFFDRMERAARGDVEPPGDLQPYGAGAEAWDPTPEELGEKHEEPLPGER